jgi:glutathione synthase/RimK-type ligase-like ATP-grasp enzyme
MRVALCTVPPFAAHTDAVIAHLRAQGVHVELHEISLDLAGTPANSFDVGWIRYAPHAAVSGRTPMYWQAAISLEAAGVPMLNSVRSHELAGNKLLTDIIFERAGIHHPRSQMVAHCRDDEFQAPFICKPIGGARAEGVVLVSSMGEARAHEIAVGSPCIAQEFIAGAHCVRVIASDERAWRMYEKRTAADNPIASVAGGADRIIVDDPGDEMQRLACECVRAVGGGLMGIDLLRTNDRALHALEINASFAFDPADETICEAFAVELGRAAK